MNSSGQGLGQADSRQNKGSLKQKLELNPTARLQNESTPNGFRPLAAIATLDLRERVTRCQLRGFVVSSLLLLLPSVRGTYPSSPLQV